MAQLTQGIIDAAIEGFESQKRRIDKQIAELRAMSNGHAPTTQSAAPPKTKKRGISAAGRKAISEAQRKRWAVANGEAVVEPPKKEKRQLSAAGRAAIIAATKKRWAAKRAEAKK